MDSSVLVEPSTGTPIENPLSVIGSGRGTTGGIVSWFYCYMISKIGHILLYTCMLLMELKKSEMLRQHSFMPYIMVGFTSKRLLTKQVDICLLVEFFCFMPV